MAHIQKRVYRSRRTGTRTTSWQARYVGPDGKERTRRFARKVDAERWLDTVGGDIARGTWVDPEGGKVQTRKYAEEWLAGRRLRLTTRSKYQQLLDHHLLPVFGDLPLAKLSPSMVRRWYEGLSSRHPATASGAYRLLSAICHTAVDDELLARTPCKIKGAGNDRSEERPTASIPELNSAVAACPAVYRLALLLAVWCQLRRGEIVGLERQDVDLESRKLTVRRSWCLQLDGTPVLGPPKTDAGVRVLTIPPNVLPALEAHLELVDSYPTAWLFPGKDRQPVSPRTIDRVWTKARAKIGRTDLRFHDLRHTGLTLAAATGASTAELMKRGGHASPAAALRYQHATTDRDETLAEALGELATSSKVVELRRTKDGRKMGGQRKRRAG